MGLATTGTALGLAAPPGTLGGSGTAVGSPSAQVSTMALPDQLLPYVNAWRAARMEGRDPTAQELCPDRPDLNSQLTELLAELRRAEDSSSVDIGGQPHAAGTIRPPEDKYPTGYRMPVRRSPPHPDRVGEYRLLEPLGKGGRQVWAGSP